MHKKIKDLSCKRIKYLIESKIPFYKWHQTYLQGIKDEIEEAENEIKPNNSVYLEDELWDVFWDYLCLLHGLESEWKITWVEKVFERCYEKFIWRVWEKANWGHNWEEIKKEQKIKRKKEHNKLYKNDKKN